MPYAVHLPTRAQLNLLPPACFSPGMLGARWPNFTWVNTDPAVFKGNYQHWGTYMPGRRLEPNNMVAPENCAGSNTTQGIMQPDKTTIMYDGLGGWADHACYEPYIFICEIEREWPAAARQLCTKCTMACVLALRLRCVQQRQTWLQQGEYRICPANKS